MVGYEALLTQCFGYYENIHYNDVIMSPMASHITSLTITYSTVYPGADIRKHQSSALLAFVRGIHRWPVNCPRKGPIAQKMFPFDGTKAGVFGLTGVNTIDTDTHISLQYQKLRTNLTGPTHKLLVSFMVVSDIYRPFIPNKNTFTKYCLS